MTPRAYVTTFALLAAGCEVRSPYDMQRDNPLGPSFWLIPTPSEDQSLLGRVFVKPPDTALSLEEQSKPNPCADQLSPANAAEMPNNYENAIDVKSSASGGALLRLYGFSADVTSATHVLYKVNTTKKVTRLDTAAYETCCKAADCGWGYLSALVYGEGEYASGQSTTASVQGSYTIMTASGATSYNVLTKKHIKGWIAATLTAHDRAKAVQACAPSEEWLVYECVPKGLAAQHRDQCAVDGSKDPMWKDHPQMQHMLAEQKERACRWLDAHGLERPRAHGRSPRKAPP